MIRQGDPARRFTAGPGVTFDADTDGVILGAHCADGADWVSEIIKLLMAGKLRIDLED